MLPTFSDAFPDGLPAYSGPLPAWDGMDFNDFAKSLRPFLLGTFEIPITNLNTHDLQRAINEEWISTLLLSLGKSKDADLHPGSAFLNTPDVPLDSEGNPDPKRMMCTIPDGCHRSTATGRMDWPEEKKTWVFTVYRFRTYQLCLIANCLLTVVHPQSCSFGPCAPAKRLDD